MADDPTGMGGAQNRDGVVAKGRQLAAGVMSRRERRAEEKRQSALAKADYKHNLAKIKAGVTQEREEGEREAESGKARVKRDPKTDLEAIEGADLSSFHRIFLRVLEKGKSRTEGTSVSDTMLRQVLTNERFIRAIETCTSRTPQEQVDTEYAKQMAAKRGRLAYELRMAREDREYSLGALGTHELDIIYSTMLGTAEEPEEEKQKKKEKKEPGRLHRAWNSYQDRRKAKKLLRMSDEERENRKAKEDMERAARENAHRSAVELWGATDWPEDLPKPHEAFFLFLESTAIREKPEDKGGYIGNVLKALSTIPTCTDNKDKVLRNLVDGAALKEYLDAKASYPIDATVQNFHALVLGALAAPSDKMHNPEGINMPGLAYEREYSAELARIGAWVAEAGQFVNQAKGLLADAKKSEAAAKEQLKAWKEKIAKGSIELRDGRVLSAGSPEWKNIEITAERGVEEARRRVGNAEAVLDKSVREMERRQGELKEFKLKGSQEAFAKELANHFKELLEENREVNFTFENVADRIAPRLPNKEVAVLLQKAEELMATREDFAPTLLGTHMADAMGGSIEAGKEGNSRSDTSVVREMLAHRTRVFEAKMKEFEESVDASPLPDETKGRIKGLRNGLMHIGVPAEVVRKEIGSIRREHGEPLRKIVQLSVDGLGRKGYRSYTGITDAEKIIALGVFEGRSGKIPSDQSGKEGFWKRKWQWVSYQLFTGESWANKSKWVWKKSIGNDIDHLRPRNMFQKMDGRKPDGTPYKRKRWFQMRLFDGLWGLTWKGYIIGTALVGHMLTTQPLNHWYSYIWPLNWSRPITLLAEKIKGGPFYIPNSQDHWYLPWSWTMPTERERVIKRVIHDHYDIPERLATREDSYYTKAYGVGTRRLEGETNDERMRARLAWVRQHPDVLRFFQERTTGRQEVKVRDIGERPENCSRPFAGIGQPVSEGPTGPARIELSKSCKKLGLASEDVIRDYQPLDGNDGWRPGMKVCCTIELTYSSVRDGRRLNKHMADQFVDLLMAAETGGVRISYGYLIGRANVSRWIDEWFLVTPDEADIVANSGITKRDNVAFLVLQGADTQRLLLPMCAREALSARYLGTRRGDDFIPAHRDEFVDSWRAEIVKSVADIDPLKKAVPPDILEQTFSSVEKAHEGWFEDRTQLYKQRLVLEKVQGLDIQSQTSLDILVAQEDILEFVKTFLPVSTTHGMSPGVNAERFVEELARHKRYGGSIEDFNPFGEAPGPRVREAIANGWIFVRAEYRNQGTAAPPSGNATAAPTAAPGAAPTVTVAPRPSVSQIPAFTQEAQRFYMNPANAAFKMFLEGQPAAMEQGADGPMLKTLIASRFNNDQAQFDRAFKADIYAFLSNPGFASIRTQMGLTVEGTGPEMVVTYDSSPRAINRLRTGLMRRLKDFCTRMGASVQPAP